MGGIGANHVLLGVKTWNLACSKFRSKEINWSSDPPPNPNYVYFIDQNRITIRQNIFSLKCYCYIPLESTWKMKQSLIKDLMLKMNCKRIIGLWNFFQAMGQNIGFKEFSIEIVTLSIKKLHECRSDPYSNLKRNNLKQLKYFGMLATNLIR